MSESLHHQKPFKHRISKTSEGNFAQFGHRCIRVRRCAD